MNTARNSEICNLYQTGQWSLRQLAKKYGVTHETIRQILKRHQIPLNPPHQRLERGN